MTNETDPDAERRRRLIAYWKTCDTLRKKLETAGVDPWDVGRYMPPFPADLHGVLCGAKTRKGPPCKQKAIYGNGRCKFHGGLSTGPRTEAGKERSRINGRKGGRPRKNPSPCEVEKKLGCGGRADAGEIREA